MIAFGRNISGNRSCRRLLLAFFSALVVSCLVLSPTPTLAQSWKEQLRGELKNGGAFAERLDGQVIFEYRSDDHFIPASTIKLAVASFALDRLGEDYRFSTEFFLTKDKKLAIKGYGDPLLVSEELKAIAHELRKSLAHVSGMIIDTAHFASPIVIDGASDTTNPYDAVNGAFLANFNTALVDKLRSGTIVPGESQTPLTPTVRRLARSYPSGMQRVNLGNNARLGTRYAGELLAEFLKQEGITVGSEIEFGPVPSGSALIFTHHSSQTLRVVIKKLLQYSTNFTANQLFLILGAEQFGPPATLDKGQKALSEFLTNKIGWHDFQIVEGSGLSRKNSVTPRQMVQLLRFFQPYRDLLPVEEETFAGKTGTLTGVNTYSGYFQLPNNNATLVRFSFLVNDRVPLNHRYQLARMLYHGVVTGKANRE